MRRALWTEGWSLSVGALGGVASGERAPRERGEGDDTDERALERADIGVDALGDCLERTFVGELDAVVGGALAQDGDAGAELGWLDLGDEAAAEALAQAFLESLEIARGPVGGDDDLAPGVVQGVEGVEELLLGARLALDEVDVVQQQHVDVAEAGLEAVGVARAERADELVREGLAARDAHAQRWAVRSQELGDGAEQVRLADAGRPAAVPRLVRGRRHP